MSTRSDLPEMSCDVCIHQDKPPEVAPCNRCDGQVNFAWNVAMLAEHQHSDGWTEDAGVKHDHGKPRYDLLPPEFLDATAQVLTFGAAKYSERNWEQGMHWGRPFAALMRHMWAWWRGEDKDPETGMSHLWHASCCIAFLVSFEARKIGVDDRPQ